jgi:predicted unusual protein kinase regulating ubiquinone biosynthesis (AarF/ABC1/UbiB family)
MVSDRPYRRGRSPQEAILELRRCAATHFDSRVVDAFIAVLDRQQDAGGMDLDDMGEIGPEESQAVFVAVCDGMFTSFRRLGGPRLATNLERTINERFYEEQLPITLQAGHLVIEEGVELSDEELSVHLQTAVRVISEHIERASGAGLADHFLSEALSTLPDRMRRHAERLGFQPAT